MAKENRGGTIKDVIIFICIIIFSIILGISIVYIFKDKILELMFSWACHNPLIDVKKTKLLTQPVIICLKIIAFWYKSLYNTGITFYNPLQYEVM